MHPCIRICTCVWMLSVPIAFAAPPDTPLTLSQAVVRVLESNPQLQAADFDTRAAVERIRQQGQSTPYELGVEMENFAGSGSASGTRGLETTLSLGRVLETGEKPLRRSAVAQLEAGLLRHDQDAQRLDLLAETARRFLALARAQAEREFALQRLGLTQQTLDTVEQRYRIGKAPAAEHYRMQIEMARAELALEETDHLLNNGRRQLAVMWGAYEPGFETVQAEILHLDTEPELASLDQTIELNPAIARLATQARLAEARLLLTRTRARPDLDLRAGIRHANDTDDVGLVLSLRMPLGSAGRSGAYSDEAESLAAREPLLAQDRKLGLRATLYALHQELLHARDRFETYQDRIIPAAGQALADYRQGYAVGRYSLLELSAAQDTLLDARLELLSAANDHHAARIEIDRLVGAAPVNGVSP
ncbi:MAG: TolC family protein [Gammaproteobacteria bacterium]|nr:TolC family protein [Gammaproteobacteria bacterium]